MDEKKFEDIVYSMLTKFYQNVLLKRLATKDDIAELRAEMATKDELSKVEDRLGKRIDRVAEVVTDLKTNHERRLRKVEDELGIESKPLSI